MVIPLNSLDVDIGSQISPPYPCRYDDPKEMTLGDKKLEHYNQSEMRLMQESSFSPSPGTKRSRFSLTKHKMQLKQSIDRVLEEEQKKCRMRNISQFFVGS